MNTIFNKVLNFFFLHSVVVKFYHVFHVFIKLVKDCSRECRLTLHVAWQAKRSLFKDTHKWNKIITHAKFKLLLKLKKEKSQKFRNLLYSFWIRIRCRYEMEQREKNFFFTIFCEREDWQFDNGTRTSMSHFKHDIKRNFSGNSWLNFRQKK